MPNEFRALQIKQLDRKIDAFRDHSPRPQRGWIRAIRQSTGLTLSQLANRLHRTASVVAHLERSEADYRITLGNLRDAADALGCDLVYAFVPKSGSLQRLAEKEARSEAAMNVQAVEHTMALEDQSAGDIERKIEEETRRILGRKRRS